MSLWRSRPYGVPSPALRISTWRPPTGTLRAVYLDGNPAQAMRDPQTGEMTGVAADLARELAKEAGAPLQLTPVHGVQAVIDAVQNGSADIGFLAPAPSRAGPLAFSQTYLRNPQGVLTLQTSALSAVADIDRPGLRIGVLRGDSIALWLARNKPRVSLVLRDADSPSETELLKAGTIDAFARNRLRKSTSNSSWERRGPAFDGRFFVAVRTNGIYCRCVSKPDVLGEKRNARDGWRADTSGCAGQRRVVRVPLR